MSKQHTQGCDHHRDSRKCGCHSLDADRSQLNTAYLSITPHSDGHTATRTRTQTQFGTAYISLNDKALDTNNEAYTRAANTSDVWNCSGADVTLRDIDHVSLRNQLGTGRDSTDGKDIWVFNALQPTQFSTPLYQRKAVDDNHHDISGFRGTDDTILYEDKHNYGDIAEAGECMKKHKKKKKKKKKHKSHLHDRANDSSTRDSHLARSDIQRAQSPFITQVSPQPARAVPANLETSVTSWMDPELNNECNKNRRKSARSHLTEIDGSSPHLISMPRTAASGEVTAAVRMADKDAVSRSSEATAAAECPEGKDKDTRVLWAHPEATPPQQDKTQGEIKQLDKRTSLHQGVALLQQTSVYLDYNRTVNKLELERFDENDPEKRFSPIIRPVESNDTQTKKHSLDVGIELNNNLKLPRKSWGESLADIKMDDEWLKWVKTQFQKVAGEDGEIDKHEFKTALGIKDQFFNDRFFSLFDTEKSGTLDFAEFTQAMTLLARGGPKDKLRFLFQVYDVDGSGSIDRGELKTVLAHCVKESSMQLSDEVLDDLAEALFESADTDNSGLISFEELCSVLEKHPGVTENLTISAANWMKKSKKGKSQKKDPLHVRIKTTLFNNKRLVRFLIIYTLINLGLFLTSLRYLDTNAAVVVARACGMSLNFNCALVLVLMLRHTLTWVRGTRLGRHLPIDQHIPLHRFVGYVIVVLSVIHTIAHFINLALVVQDDDSGEKRLKYHEYLFTFRSRIGLVSGFAHLSGLILFIFLMVMFICALPFIRRNGHFEVFYFTHLLYVLFWFVLLMHGPIFWAFFLIPGLIFILEAIVPYIKKKWKKQKFYITKVNLLPSKVTHLVISRPESFSYRPGDYIFIRFPGIAKYEYHPFTISSAPELKGELWLHIRAVGSWTNMLHDYFEKKKKRQAAVTSSPHHSGEGKGPQVTNGVSHRAVNGTTHTNSELTEVVVAGAKESKNGSLVKPSNKVQDAAMHEEVSIRGPYGTPTREIFESEHAVLIGSGIGVTPFAAILQSVTHRFKARKRGEVHPDGPMNLNKVDFIWVNREQRAFEWFISLLSQLEAEEDDAEDFDSFYDMQMYMTAALSMNDMKGLGLQMALDAMHKKQNKDVVTGLKQRVQPGRPDWAKVFSAIAAEKKGRVNVFFCGSPLLAKTLREYCDKFNFSFSKEEF